MNNQSFDVQRIAEGYAKRPWLHKEVINQIKKDCNIESFENGEFSVSEVREWMTQGLQGIFDGKTRSLMFQGYSWYIRKRSC